MNTTVDDSYNKFIIKVNKNSTTDNVTVNKGVFVFLFNEEQNKFLEGVLDRRNDDEIRYIQHFLINEHPLKQNTKFSNRQEYKLPKDFFDFADVYGKADSDCCKKERIDLYEIKKENIGLILQDENNKPDFDYREAPFNIASDSIIAYRDGFEYTELFLSYYRYPKQIALINPNNPESGFSQQDPEWDNKSLDRILSMCAAAYSLNNDNPKYQAEKQRAISKY